MIYSTHINGYLNLSPIIKEKIIAKHIAYTKINFRFLEIYGIQFGYCKANTEFALLQSKGIFPYYYSDDWETLQ